MSALPKRIAKTVLLAAMAAFMFWLPDPVYGQYRITNEESFGKTVYSEILHRGTPLERVAIWPVLAAAEDVFGGMGLSGEIAGAGALSEYTRYLHAKRGASQEHRIRLVSVWLNGETGAVWVEYYYHVYDAAGEAVTGSGSREYPILARWAVELRDGNWTVTNVQEAP